MSAPKGIINVTHTVWCGMCSVWEESVEQKRSEAAKVFRTRGWKLTHKYGWICPRCLKLGNKEWVSP